MTAEIRSCRASELADVVELLTEQFVHGSARSTPLAHRYPDLFCPNEAHNIITAWIGSELVGATVTRPFQWATPMDLLGGLMVGFVCTNVQFRNQGIASEILAVVRGQATIRGLDFAVLWTRQPAFYERFGWDAHDSSATGTHQRDTPLLLNRRPSKRLRSKIALNIESLRRESQLMRVLRSPTAYMRVPLPAHDVRVELARDSRTINAYSLLGVGQSKSCVYEVVGTPQERTRLINNARRAHHQTTWYAQHAERLAQDPVASDWNWRPDHHAMWLPFSDRVNPIDFDQWYIPVFDRF